MAGGRKMMMMRQLACGQARRLGGVRSTSSTVSHTAASSSPDAETIIPALADKATLWEELPGPLSLPLIGTSYAFFFGKQNRAQLHVKSRKLAKQYGEVVKLSMGPERTFGISCPKLTAEIMRQEDPVPIRESPLPWAEYVKANNAPGALLTSQGDDWLRKRQAVRSLMLKPASMDGMAGEIEDICTDMCTHIADQRDSQGYISCLPDHLYRFSFEAIIAVLFGERIGCLNVGSHPFKEEFISSINEILSACYGHLAVLAPVARKYNTKSWRNHEQAWNYTKESANYLMDRLIARVSENRNCNNNVIALSLLTNPKLSNEDITFMLMEFLFGGVDTTSHTIGFLLHCLAANPDKQQKLRDEVDVVIKESNGGRITAEQTHKLKYFQMCLKESFRLYPILFINGRKIREDFISRNRNIQFKKDDMAIFFYHAINRDTNVWERADEFIPERFDREKTTSDSPGRQFVSIPFGHGIRGCIGKRLAEMELCQLTVKILERFELRLGDKYEFSPITRAVLTPGAHIPVRFIDRL